MNQTALGTPAAMTGGEEENSPADNVGDDDGRGVERTEAALEGWRSGGHGASIRGGARFYDRRT